MGDAVEGSLYSQRNKFVTAVELNIQSNTAKTL